MSIRSFMLTALLAGCAATGPQLTPLEQQKLDPALQRLILGTPASRTEYDITPGPSGENLYGVIVRTGDPEELRKAGLIVSSVFGEVAVVHVTGAQLRTLVTLPGVRTVSNGSRNRTQ